MVWMVGAVEIDALVIFVAGEVHRVGAIEHYIARLALGRDEVEQCREAQPLPLADAAPALDAVVPGDLGSRRQLFERGQRETPRPFGQSANGKPPVGKFTLGEPLVFGIARFGRPVGAEFGGEVGLAVLAGERSPADGHPLRKAGERFGAFEQFGELEVVRKPVAAAQHQAADATGGTGEKAAAARMLQIRHVRLQCHTSR